MTDTDRLGLPLIDAAQAQKHVTHNAALERIDALMHLGVVTRTSAPPATVPADARYLVAGTPAGVFSGYLDHIALQQDGAWQFLAPQVGWRIYVQDEAVLLVHDGTTWRDVATNIRSLDQLTHLGLGTGADASNPLAVKLNNALFTARGVSEGGLGDLRFKLNREAGTNTVSQLYQSNWSGRAETGLMGDDLYRIKVSADGSSWANAITIEPSTVNIAFGGVARPATDNACSLGSAAARWSTVYAATGTINTSGSKEKTDVVPIRDGLGFIRTLKPVSFRWIVGGVTREETPANSVAGTSGPRFVERPGRRVHYGLIAEEVKQATDAMGLDLAVYVHDPETDRHGLRYDQLIAPLIKAVQELDAKIAAIEARGEPGANVAS